MSLKDPTKKMSKSEANPMSRILITDSREEIHDKIKCALTDSIDGITYDPQGRPGVSNLIDIMYHMNEDAASSPEQLAKDLIGEHLSKSALKEKVADTIDNHIHEVRERYAQTMSGPLEELEEVLFSGYTYASASSGHILKKVREVMGLVKR